MNVDGTECQQYPSVYHFEVSQQFYRDISLAQRNSSDSGLFS